MPQPLVECVPNFSDGRRPEVIAAIRDAIRTVAGVVVLDTHSDADHNRTVLTFVAPPEAALEAALAGTKRAAELIDMTHHSGAHPRIGATDVVPFIPLQGITLAECVQLARRLGRRIADELGIPVYLYEAAASRPERQNLEAVREGQIEALRAEIATRPERAPDFGPAHIGPAGATVVGARPPLIAYKAQVSLNLTDYPPTPMARVPAAVRREAARLGARVMRSEVVGLLPQAALVDAAAWYMQIDSLSSQQLIERRLQEPETAARLAPKETGFLDALATSTPAPGGGSAAAYAAAMAAALLAMVARLTVDRKKYAAVREEMLSLLAEVETLRPAMQSAVNEDAAAFEAVMAARRLPKGSSEQNLAAAQALRAATLRAAEVPLGVARSAARLLELALSAAERANAATITDAGSAGHMANAALQAALLNVRVNALSLGDDPQAHAFSSQADHLQARSADLLAKMQRAAQARMSAG
ncbi:MAG: glutamate formimidoyltransferase [Chloroflexi bacterium]|nr:glutamate formimidoyltransferase [Chloroflexota bacterium]